MVRTKALLLWHVYMEKTCITGQTKAVLILGQISFAIQADCIVYRATHGRSRMV